MIGLLGGTGNTTGPQLHFEIRIGGANGTRIDPYPTLDRLGLLDCSTAGRASLQEPVGAGVRESLRLRVAEALPARPCKPYGW